jgi:ATP-dependent DNA helicase RecG
MDELLPIEVSKYDQKIVLEALHNCIVHQDYTRNGRVVVTEQPDRLRFENEGSFFEGQPDDYIPGTRTPRRYRNPLLAQAMVELNMIDTMGYGIHEMHERQARRYLPLPDYDLTEAGAVKITLYGGVVDPAYTRLLMQKTDLSLSDILALDRVQKNLAIPEIAVARLKRANLIEGRRPHLHVSALVAAATGEKAAYIRTRALDDAHYARLLTDYLKKFGTASRTNINDFLVPKLSEALTEEQKVSKINNLLTKWRKSGLIRNLGSDRAPRWMLAEKNE